MRLQGMNWQEKEPKCCCVQESKEEEVIIGWPGVVVGVKEI